SCPSAIDTNVLTSHDVQGNPQTDPLLTCRYSPPPSSSGGPEYALEISWVTPKASPDTHPYYGCGQKASSPAVVVSQDHGRARRLLRSEEHTSELQSRGHLVCRLLLEKKK